MHNPNPEPSFGVSISKVLGQLSTCLSETDFYSECLFEEVKASQSVKGEAAVFYGGGRLKTG